MIFPTFSIVVNRYPIEPRTCYCVFSLTKHTLTKLWNLIFQTIRISEICTSQNGSGSTKNHQLINVCGPLLSYLVGSHLKCYDVSQYIIRHFGLWLTHGPILKNFVRLISEIYLHLKCIAWRYFFFFFFHIFDQNGLKTCVKCALLL